VRYEYLYLEGCIYAMTIQKVQCADIENKRQDIWVYLKMASLLT
jgi:hypothetical protein